MDKRVVAVLLLTVSMVLWACGNGAEEVEDTKSPKIVEEEAPKEEAPKEEGSEEEKEEKSGEMPSVEEIAARYQGQVPEEWGEEVTGVKTGIDTEEKVIALTFDACGGGYDGNLIQYLKENQIPATLFISGGWIDNHPEVLETLWKHPSFDIANHGKDHKPLSVTGKSAYGIPGTDSVEGVYEEVYDNHRRIKEITGQGPKFFRSGTAYYDEVAVSIAKDLGQTVVNYNVLGDGGATFTADQIYEAMIRAEAGSIMLFHMNHPHSDVAKGVKRGIEALQEEGFEFVLLKDHRENLE